MDNEQVPKWAVDILERLASIETTIKRSDKTDEVATAADNRSKENERRLNKLEESHTWLWRTMLAAIISGGVGSLFALAGRFH
ncbi:hemolysin XhlA family protein [Alicyclobacillus acidoterrestris]|uniref:hemolysin XhlA family protein n=1 Tax=Alicyclobacillus acidoterrestris TaxID=1450 RepID=UPI003F53D8E2